MNVQEVIDALQKIKDKSKDVTFECPQPLAGNPLSVDRENVDEILEDEQGVFIPLYYPERNNWYNA